MNWKIFRRKNQDTAPNNFLEELHKPFNDEEKELKELSEYLKREKVFNHVKRILKCITINELGSKIDFKISALTYGAFSILLESGKLKFSEIFARDTSIKYLSLVHLNISIDRGVFVVAYDYADVTKYENEKANAPLFYSTLDMNDEEFELWFKLTY